MRQAIKKVIAICITIGLMTFTSMLVSVAGTAITASVLSQTANSFKMNNSINDTIVNEYVLTTITDRLETSGTVKNHEFVLPKAGRVSLTFSHPNIESSSEYWSITLFDSNTNNLLDFKSAGDKTSVSSINNYLSAGTYKIRVQKYNGFNNSDYDIKVNYTENIGQFEIEQNNTSETETEIFDVSKPIAGNLYQSSDIDYYKFVLSKAGRISLTFSHPNIESSSEYWSITLFDSDTNNLLDFKSAGNKTSVSSINNYLSAGTYKIRIQKYNGFNNSDYDIRVNYTENIGQFEIESNDTKEKSTPISRSNIITGNLFKNGDVDFYKIAFSQSYVITLEFSHINIESSSDYWNISIFDESDKELISAKFAGNIPKTESQKLGVNAGSYIIRVQKSTLYSDADYTLTIKTLPTETKKQILGDADGDEKVTVKDATYIQKHVAKIIIIAEINLKASDSDGDGKITVKDATVIQKYVAKIKVNSKIGEEIT